MVNVPVSIATDNLLTEIYCRSESWANFKKPNKYMVKRPKITIHIAIKSSLSSKWACKTRSAFDKNLNASAISRNPRVTLTEFSQPPLWGNEFNQPGKAANNPKGNAIAKEKPNIPIIGPKYPPEDASTNRVPTIGPVHENDTNARVNAIKKIPISPPLSEALSLLFTQDAGSCNSKAPRKDAPKIISKRKKPILK